MKFDEKVLTKAKKNLTEIATVHYEKDPKVQDTKRQQLNDETIPFYLKKLEEVARTNNGHMALNRTTWADFVRSKWERIFVDF